MQFEAEIVSNALICREHFRIVLRGGCLDQARPGQFLHIRPALPRRPSENGDHPTIAPPHPSDALPLLRRAFSIAALNRAPDGPYQATLIYRVVGKATRWMQRLQPGEIISAIGPLGNGFTVQPDKKQLWLVAGGVGLPPMLYLAQFLHAAGETSHRVRTIAFVGAATGDLIPLQIDPQAQTPTDRPRADTIAAEFSAYRIPVVISTDDGSAGFAGSVVQAVAECFAEQSINPDDLQLFACGPEPMLHALATFCRTHAVDCQLCMERSMACGTGTCQSCVVPVRADDATDRWRYALCCTEGPVFSAQDVLWHGADG